VRGVDPCRSEVPAWSAPWRWPTLSGAHPAFHGELLKLGFSISQRTVARLVPHPRKPPSQSWRTFLQNHLADLSSNCRPASGGAKGIPARRAFESPIAIACLAERAPCFPSLT